MADYSVTIKLNGSLEQIMHELKLAFGGEIAKNAKIIADGSVNYFDSCTTLGHFGCVHWSDDDVESRFKDLNIPMTQALLEEVKGRIRHIDDGMVELGWEVIEAAILDATDALAI